MAAPDPGDVAAAHFTALETLLCEAAPVACASLVGAEPLTGEHLQRLRELQLKAGAAYARYALATAIPMLESRRGEGGRRPRTLQEQQVLMAVASTNTPAVVHELLDNFACQLKRLADDAATLAAKEPRAAGQRGRPRRPTVPGTQALQRLQDLVQRLDQQVMSVGNTLRYREATGATQAVARAAALTAAAASVTAVECEFCEECAVALVIDSGRSEAQCPECRQVIEMHGVVYEDAHLRLQEGQRSKSGAFSPNMHGRTWLQRLQGLENKGELGDPRDPDNLQGEKLIEKLRALAARKGMPLRLLDLEGVRGLLRDADCTKYNRNAALILKELSGRGPPILAEAKRVRVEALFTQVIQARAQLSDHRPNRNYYPYYLYKILDLVLADDDPDRLILCYIHLQGENTLQANDHEWRGVCEQLELEWRPTSAAKTHEYRQRFETA